MAFPRTPSHAEFRPALRLNGSYAPGTSLPAGVAVYQRVAVGGATKVRVRLLVSGVGGSLVTAFAYVTNAGVETQYATGATTTAIAAGTETLIELYPGGESWLALTFTPTAGGSPAVVTWCDVSQS